MEFLKHLRMLDEGLKTAENQLLNEDINGHHQIVEEVTNGPFAGDALGKLEEVRKILDEHKQTFAESSNFFGGERHPYYQTKISEGYAPIAERRKYWPKKAISVHKVMVYVRGAELGDLVKRLWYWEMTQTLGFADKYVKKFGNFRFGHTKTITKLTLTVGRETVEESVSESPYLDEFFDLSALRDLSYELWDRVVRNSIHRRVKTPLEQIARFFQLKLPWVELIARIHKPKNDEITRNLVYICKNPDFTSELLVDVPVAEDGQVIYLVVCPSCGRNNKQGTLSCNYCGSKI